MSSGAVGALAQVQAVSNLSLWLDVAPECTFFQQDFCRHSPFAICESDISPQSGIDWGRTLQFEVPRAGDLCGDNFLKLKIKGLRYAQNQPAGAGADPRLMWVNALGHAACRTVHLEVGQIQVDQFTGEFMEIIEQHLSPLGNEQGSAIGSFDNAGDLRDWSYNDQTLHIHLPFFFSHHPEMYLPIIALSSHPVRVKVELRAKNVLINADDGNNPAAGVDVSVAGVLDSTYNGSLVDAALVTRMVFLDQFERNLVSAEVHEIVMTEHQENQCEPILVGTLQKSMTLSFNNAILAMFSRFRPDSYVSPTNYDGKDYFHYCVPRPNADQPPHLAGATNLEVNPFSTMQLRFNGADRIAPREAEYFTDVTPYLHAVKKSRSQCILFYSFHLAPLSDPQTPAGHAMLSRIHESKIQVVFKDDGAGGSIITQAVGDGEWCVMAIGYNVLRISMGQAIKKFA